MSLMITTGSYRLQVHESDFFSGIFISKSDFRMTLKNGFGKC